MSLNSLLTNFLERLAGKPLPSWWDKARRVDFLRPRLRGKLMVWIPAGESAASHARPPYDNEVGFYADQAMLCLDVVNIQDDMRFVRFSLAARDGSTKDYHIELSLAETLADNGWLCRTDWTTKLVLM